jgi:hypothetical protein
MLGAGGIFCMILSLWVCHHAFLQCIVGDDDVNVGSSTVTNVLLWLTVLTMRETEVSGGVCGNSVPFIQFCYKGTKMLFLF